MNTDVIMEVRNLAFSYNSGRQIFSDIDFELHKGEVFVILGANGAGKSTLLNCMSNILSASCGEVLLKGQAITKYPINEVAKIIGYVPQLSAPAFSYTVRDYIVMGRAPHMGILNVPGQTEYDMADQIMAELEIGHLADKIFLNISGGERQQVQIARVLVQESEIVLLDEPTNHLDYGNQLKIIHTISRLARERELAVVLTSHMPDHAILLNGTVGILNHQGRLTVGSAKDVISENSLKTLYNTDLHLVYIEELQRVACVAGKSEEYRK